MQWGKGWKFGDNDRENRKERHININNNTTTIRNNTTTINNNVITINNNTPTINNNTFAVGSISKRSEEC